MSRLTPSKLPDNENPNKAVVRDLPAILANMLIARIDFLGRFVMSLLYGVLSRINQLPSVFTWCDAPPATGLKRHVGAASGMRQAQERLVRLR